MIMWHSVVLWCVCVWYLNWFFILALVQFLSFNIINFSHFFFLKIDVQPWECGNVPPSDAVYISTQPFVALPSLLLLFHLLFCYKFLTSSLFPFSNPSFLLLSYFPFLPDWRWFTFFSSRPSCCRWLVVLFLFFVCCFFGIDKNWWTISSFDQTVMWCFS